MSEVVDNISPYRKQKQEQAKVDGGGSGILVLRENGDCYYYPYSHVTKMGLTGKRIVLRCKFLGYDVEIYYNELTLPEIKKKFIAFCKENVHSINESEEFASVEEVELKPEG